MYWGWHWLRKLYGLQVYNSAIVHLIVYPPAKVRSSPVIVCMVDGLSPFLTTVPVSHNHCTVIWAYDFLFVWFVYNVLFYIQQRSEITWFLPFSVWHNIPFNIVTFFSRLGLDSWGRVPGRVSSPFTGPPLPSPGLLSWLFWGEQGRGLKIEQKGGSGRTRGRACSGPFCQGNCGGIRWKY